MSKEQCRDLAIEYLHGYTPRGIASVDFRPTAFTDYVERCLPSLLRDGLALVLCGAVGAGKSYAGYYAVALAGVIGWAKGQVVPARDLSKMAIDHKDDFDRLLADTRLLVVDDIGAEFQSDWSKQVVEALIDHRQLYRLPTIFTTNMTRKTFGEAMGARALSRIIGWGWYAEVSESDAPDLRRRPEPTEDAADYALPELEVMDFQPTADIHVLREAGLTPSQMLRSLTQQFTETDDVRRPTEAEGGECPLVEGSPGEGAGEGEAVVRPAPQEQG